MPQVSLFNVVRNKQLVALTGTKSLILVDVVASLGHKLVRDEQLSSVSCLTCARTEFTGILPSIFHLWQSRLAKFKKIRLLAVFSEGIHDILLHSTAIHFLQEKNVNV